VSPEEVLRTHAERDVPPMRLLADDVLVIARRRVRRGRIRMLAVAGVAAVLAIGGVVFAAPRLPDGGPPAVIPTRPVTPSPSTSRSVAPLSCRVAAIPAPPGLGQGQWMVYSIDPTGRHMVGGYQSAPSVTGLLVWKDGVPSRPVEAKEFSPHAVNRDGTAAGFIRKAGGRRSAALYRNGAVVQLPVPAGTTESAALAVNARGDAVGYAVIGDNERNVGLVWPVGGGVVELSADAGRTAQAAGVTDDGVVVGVTKSTDGNAQAAYRWGLDGGQGTPLAKGTAGSVAAVGGDWAVGEAPLTAPRDPDDLGPWHARWNVRTGTVEPLGLFTPFAVSASGTVLGRPTERSSGLHVWHDGGVTALPALSAARRSPLHAGMTGDGATIVAAMTDGDSRGQIDNTRWTC
jgi:hypothetical protein